MDGGHTPSVADVLDAAADLLTPEGAWTQDWFARDSAGREEEATSPDATCWCVRGAVFAVCGTDTVDEEKIFRPLRDLLGIELMPVEEWNDMSSTTQAEVISKLREAANAARATSKEAQGNES